MPIDKHSAQLITSTVTQPTQSSAPGIWRLEDVNNSVALNRWPLAPNLLRRSLRFNSADSAYLNRTPAVSGSQTTWTWSAWVKRAGLYTTNAGPTLFDAGPNNSNFTFIRFLSDTQDTIDFGWVVSNSIAARLRSNALFRDTSAWYHIVSVLDTTNVTSINRMRLYINGQELTSFAIATYPAQGTATCQINATNIHYLGRSVEPLYRYMDGYMTEVNFVDGQALTPASFGETDPQTGVWVPKIYTGTYGTNGFRLNFSNNSSTTALGYDSSGLGNNWTANNFSVVNGTDNDSLLDTPSIYGVDTGLGGEVGGTYCTINSLIQNTSVATLSNGNLQGTTGTSGVSSAYIGTIGFNSGKWYFEVHVGAVGTNNMWIGISKNQAHKIVDAYTNTWTYNKLGQKTDNAATGSSYGAAYTTGDIIGVAVDADTGSITFYKNGVSQGVAFTGLSMSGGVYAIAGSDNSATIIFNFGQRSFAFPAPAGYKCLTTQNLSTPLGNVGATQANKYFDVVTYIGNGGTQTISSLGFQPDLVWIKNRDAAGENHRLIDSVRGQTKVLYSSLTNAEDPNNTDTLTAFTINGFSVGNNSAVNGNTNRIVAWCWNAGGSTVTNTSGTITSSVRANQTAGFSVIRFTGSATNNTVGHGLGTAPAFIIVKAASESGQSWRCYHQSLGLNQFITLDTTAVSETLANYWGSSAFTTDVFGVYAGGGAGNNRTGQTMIAYCWAAIPGFSAFGSYTGNGSTDGPFVYTGFRPKWVLIKVSTGSPAADWVLHDTSRSPYNVSDIKLSPNTTAGDVTSSAVNVDILSSGFKIRNTDGAYNTSANSYIYAAFAETPFKNTRAR